MSDRIFAAATFDSSRQMSAAPSSVQLLIGLTPSVIRETINFLFMNSVLSESSQGWLTMHWANIVMLSKHMSVQSISLAHTMID